MRYWLAGALLLLWGLAGFAAADELEIIALKYRSAEQLIPVIRPLLARGGTVSGMQNQLVLRTTRANLADIRKVLDRLDAMPRRLMISVRQDAEAAEGRTGARLGGGSGGSASDPGSQAPGPGMRGTNVRIYETRGASDDRITQQIQVLEGSPATIHVGRSVPVPSQTLVQGIAGVTASNTVTYRDFATGFEVVPRVSGERVVLQISPQRETPTDRLGGGTAQRAATVLSGRLGEWLELGGSMRNEQRGDAGVLLGAAGQRKDRRSIWVKVEELQ